MMTTAGYCLAKTVKKTAMAKGQNRDKKKETASQPANHTTCNGKSTKGRAEIHTNKHTVVAIANR